MVRLKLVFSWSGDLNCWVFRMLQAPPFSPVFKALGLLVDTRDFSDGTVLIGHTEERTAELCQMIQDLLTEGNVSPKALERLHGRLVWFNSFIFGRKLNSAVRSISRFARLKTSKVSVEAELGAALGTVQHHLQSFKPARVTANLTRAWIVFTDGAYEPTHSQPGSIGGVLINPDGFMVEFFGCAVAGSLLDEFMAESNHPIYELEIFPVLVAAKLWSHLFVDSLVVHYIDNEAACSAMVRADGAPGERFSGELCRS